MNMENQTITMTIYGSINDVDVTINYEVTNINLLRQLVKTHHDELRTVKCLYTHEIINKTCKLVSCEGVESDAIELDEYTHAYINDDELDEQFVDLEFFF